MKWTEGSGNYSIIGRQVYLQTLCNLLQSFLLENLKSHSELVCPFIVNLTTKTSLKVDGNEKRGESGEVIVIQVLYGIEAIEGYFKFERVLSL